jgi:hypothetical protein
MAQIYLPDLADFADMNSGWDAYVVPGCNIRWLLRMMAKKGISPFLRLLQVSGLGKLARLLRQIFVSNPLRPCSMNWALA